MRDRCWLLWVPALMLGLAAVDSAADPIGRFFKTATKTDMAVALSRADPTGATDGAGGYPLVAEDLGVGGASGYNIGAVTCALRTGGTGITGGSIRWWGQTADGGWAAASNLDEAIGNPNEQMWVSKPIKHPLARRVYCQPLAVTETGAGLDAGLAVEYTFRLEQP
ncbi:MAG: hypothetical protein ACRD4T_00150 [Candidatus Acidiferrales bacterium]